MPRRHRLRRNQEDEQIAGFDGTADSLVVALTGRKVFLVEEYVMPGRLQLIIDARRGLFVRRGIGEKDVHRFSDDDANSGKSSGDYTAFATFGELLDDDLSRLIAKP
jgi:hypothetical protein